MKRFYGEEANMVTIEVVCIDPVVFLSRITDFGAALYRVRYINDLTVQARVKHEFIDLIRKEIERYGGSCQIVQVSDVSIWIQQFPRRAILIFGILFILFLTIYLPTRIMFIKVSGNSVVPTNLILNKVESCGVNFGTSRRSIKSEEIENMLISEIPELQWVGINTKGCVAEISVREKSKTDPPVITKNVVSNIVANRDGVIISKTILQGTATCEIGEAVVAGQVLVSGYTDCGMIIQATRAEAEVLAQTRREIHMISPIKYRYRGDVFAHKTRYSLLFGKKRINLYKDSGISGASCVKICEQDYLSLPGAFFLPIGVVKEHIYNFQMREDQNRNFDWLEAHSNSYLQTQMVAGQIVDSNTDITFDAECVHFTGQYDCIEMIGQTKLEEILVEYGVSN